MHNRRALLRIPFSILSPISLVVGYGACLLFISALQAKGEEGAPLLHTLEGDSFAADIIEINKEGIVASLEGEATRAIQWNALRSWGALHESFRGPQILLSSGDLVVADIDSLDEEGVSISSPLFAPWHLPFESVRAILFAPAVDASHRDKLFDAIDSIPGGVDRALLANGDTIEGILLGMEGGNLLLDVDNQSREIPIVNIIALILDADLLVKPEQPGSIALGFRDGSRLHANELAWSEDCLRIELPGMGVATTARFANPIREIHFLQNESEQYRFLSQCEPTSYQHTPYLNINWPLGINRTPASHWLRVSGKLYQHGISMQSQSRVEYAIDPALQRFECELAFDDSGRSQGNAIGAISLCDSSGTWSEAFRIELRANQTSPIPITIDLDEAVGIALRVDFGERADVGDVVNWLNPRLVHSQEAALP